MEDWPLGDWDLQQEYRPHPRVTFLTPLRYYARCHSYRLHTQCRPWRRHYRWRLIWARASSRVTHLSRSCEERCFSQRVIVTIEEVPLPDSCWIDRTSPKWKRYLSPTCPVWRLLCDWWPARPQAWRRGWVAQQESASHGHVIKRAGKLIPFIFRCCYARSLQQTNTGQNLFQEVS